MRRGGYSAPPNAPLMSEDIMCRAKGTCTASASSSAIEPPSQAFYTLTEYGKPASSNGWAAFTSCPSSQSTTGLPAQSNNKTLRRGITGKTAFAVKPFEPPRADAHRISNPAP